MPTIPSLKHNLCDVGRRMWERGYCAGNDGNLSCRLTRGRFLATPTGVSKGFLTPAMMTMVDGEARPLGPRSRYQRTSEIFLHLAIYARRPDVQAIVHAHSPHATAFACSGVPLPQGVYPEAEVCLGAIPTVPYSKAGYKELGANVVAHIRDDTNAVLLGNHGALTFARDLVEAFYKLEMLEAYCQILLLLKRIGRVNLLSAEQLAELIVEKKRMGHGDGRGHGPLEQRFFKGMRPASLPLPRSALFTAPIVAARDQFSRG